jgi:hypothetical protein
MSFLSITTFALLLIAGCNAFSTPSQPFQKLGTSTAHFTSTTTTTTSTSLFSENDDSSSYNGPTLSSIMDRIEESKEDLVRLCKSSTKPSLEDVRTKVNILEELSEQGGIGQASCHSGLLSGEWELIYSPEDVTRSSPFFWAFRRAFPDQSDQIFGITDAIPAPIKEVGPAIQTIDMNAKTFVSQVKVATLGGVATSMMTTRATILGVEGLEGLRLKVETTKPESSTILEKLGPLGQFVNENSPPFPSGEALEKVQPGSSEVIMQTTFCDEGLRISRNNDSRSDVYVWQRKSFGSGMML